MNVFLTYRLIVCLALFCCIIACGEDEEATSPATDILATHTPTAFAAEKAAGWQTVPAAPQMPTDGTPFVRSVNYYADWRRTQTLTEPVAPGTTIYTHIVFSEGMDYVAADTNKARPILYYRIAGTLTRYRITAFGAAGADFLSGDCKPLKTQAAYLAKYIVGEEDTGAFTLAVGKRSADRDGNELAAFYVHKHALQFKVAAVADDSVGDPVEATSVPVDGDAPTVTEVGFYKDLQLQQPITEPNVLPGTTVYTKVVFSRPMQQVWGRDASARPVLSFLVNDVERRYRVRQRGRFDSGDCKPKGRGGDVYVCKWTMRAGDWGTFSVKVGAASADEAGVPLGVAYIHTPPLLLGEASLRLSGTRVEENQPVGTVIGRLSHISAASPMYRLVDAETSNLFSIDTSGYLRTQVTLNHEVRSFYEVEIEETQTQTRESFGIWVLDVNEPPTGLRLTRDTFYREDGVGTEIGEVRVVDEDGSKDTYMFEVVSGSEYVGVNENVLVVLKVFASSSQEIVLEVRDSGSLSYRETFTITMVSKPAPVPASDASEEPASTPDSDASDEPPPPREPLPGAPD